MSKIKVSVPRSSDHPLTRITARAPDWNSSTVLDDSFIHAEIEIPDGVSADDVEIVGEYCDARGQRDGRVDALVLKAAAKAAEPPKETPLTAPPPPVPETSGEKVTASATDAAPASAPATDSSAAPAVEPAAGTDAAPAPAKPARSKKS